MINNLTQHSTMISNPVSSQKDGRDQALAFHYDNPTESLISSARIFHVNENTVKAKIHRCRKRELLLQQQPPPLHGSQNRILSDTEIEAIVQYSADMFTSGLGGATPHMKQRRLKS
jgi:hypothetical protein